MKYALISDIHGNFPALLAVLDDARVQGAEQYVFLGDYIEDLPWPNEVTNTIKSLKNVTVIKGNKEGYLENMRGVSQSGWVYEQMAPMYWNYRELTTKNLDFLISLPSSVEITTPNEELIHLSHSSSIFYRAPRIEPFYSSGYLLKMQSEPFNHIDYLAATRQAVCENDEAISEISALPGGVYVFGHNHLQWHMKLGDKIFINPGSCGMPLDFDIRAPYTLLEWTADGWRIEERRVPYDVEATISALESSELFVQAKIWSKIMIKQLRTGGDYISHFLMHVETVAKERNYTKRPVSNEIWHEAAGSFKLMRI